MRRHITEARLLSRFKKLFGEPETTIIAIGDFEQRKHRKFKEPIKWKGFRTLFRKAGATGCTWWTLGSVLPQEKIFVWVNLTGKLYHPLQKKTTKILEGHRKTPWGVLRSCIYASLVFYHFF
jgi:hypothetical protein